MFLVNIQLQSVGRQPVVDIRNALLGLTVVRVMSSLALCS